MTSKITWIPLLVGLILFAGVGLVEAEAASLRLTPTTGVYEAGSTFTAEVQVVTAGQAINAAEGTLSFNTNELSVVSVNRSRSIFNLWVTEPTFSNTAGTIAFSGGVPSGYTGSVGNVLSVTFRAKNTGAPRVSFTDGSVLANDGRGTNILTAMNGGSYTIQAVTTDPEPERIVEYIPPANTPPAPTIQSETHPDPALWHQGQIAELSWVLPAGVTGVRTLLNENPTSIPTNVYDPPIDSITLSDLPEGESYFHLQFRNADGWGQVTHYRLAVDATAPKAFSIESAPEQDPAAPEHVLQLTIEDDVSFVNRYAIKIDTAEPYEYIDETGSGTIPLPPLDPGYHTVIIEAFDAAGNSAIASHSFTIEAFAAPEFTTVPSQMTTNVIPVFGGTTRPNAVVDITFSRVGAEPNTYQVTASDAGEFTFIPEGSLQTGVYEISAVATDESGAKSAQSATGRIAVQEPGYIRLGNQFVDAMSIIVPLILLVLLLIFGFWYAVYVFRRFRGVVRVESVEALDILHREFSNLQQELRSQEAALQASRKTSNLTKAEASMIEAFDRALQSSQHAVEKEIEDVTKLTEVDSKQ